LADFLREIGVWNEASGRIMPSHNQGLASLGLKAQQLLLAHANYQSADAMWRPNTTIVYCPRTHAAFGHPPHPFREFLARGVRVCLGTDSLASNPDLDILAEARFVRSRHPDFPGSQLLKMITLAGAEARTSSWCRCRPATNPIRTICSSRTIPRPQPAVPCSAADGTMARLWAVPR
jgi:aminodeoxyfutalosine deaminase